MLPLFLSFAFAAADPKVHGCWTGDVRGGKVELILSKDPKVSDALWFDDGHHRLVADISCKKSSTVDCAIEDDGGKFILEHGKAPRLKFKGEFARVRTDDGDRVALDEGKPASSELKKMSDADCRKKTQELFKIFGVGP